MLYLLRSIFNFVLLVLFASIAYASESRAGPLVPAGAIGNEQISITTGAALPQHWSGPAPVVQLMNTPPTDGGMIVTGAGGIAN